MMSDFHNRIARVELASRKNAGIQVTLLWMADTNDVAVLVQPKLTALLRHETRVTILEDR
jgi:hypothetical protein